MKTVTTIMPKTNSAGIKKRVAAYCRVSTDSDKQLESLDTQIRHYESLISSNPDWEYAGVYYDEGISGTKKERRPELLRLVSDCESGLIDYILTKSISRFARNTTDCLEIVRKLQNIKVYIYFESENIDTGNMQNELILTVLSELAESESKSISQNNRWSIKRRFQNGTYKSAHAPFGFDIDDGNLTVNEKEAQTVRFIYDEFLAGYGCGAIAKKLNEKDIRTRSGAPWTSSSVLNIVTNEKNAGDALFQKTYTDENFNRKINKGEREQYYFKNHHRPIVERDIYQTAQAIIKQRAKDKGAFHRKTSSCTRYAFSGKIVCEHCGNTLKRQVHQGNYVTWCCGTHIADYRRCPQKYIRESSIEYAFVSMINKIIFSKDKILRPFLSELRNLNSDAGNKTIAEIDKKLAENAEQQKVLLGLLTKGYLESAIYNKGNAELIGEQESLKKQKASYLKFSDNGNKCVGETNSLLQFALHADMLSGFDENIFNRFVEKVHAYSRDEIGFELKCGLTLKEKLT